MQIEVRRKSDGMLLHSNTNDALGRRCGSEFWDAPSGGYRTQLYVNDGWQVSSTYELILGLETRFSHTTFGNGIDEPLMLEVLDVHDVNGNMVTEEYLKYYYHRDTLGTITHLTNAYGEIVERYECTPFGKTAIFIGPGADLLWNTPDDLPAPDSRVCNTFIFQGRELEAESGLYYFRTRHYAPAEGRFVQRDRPGDWCDIGNLGNGYNFVWCAPLTIRDPMGFGPRDSINNIGRNAYTSLAHAAATLSVGIARGTAWGLAADLLGCYLSGQGGVYTLNSSQLDTIRNDPGVQNAIGGLYAQALNEIEKDPSYINFICGSTIQINGKKKMGSLAFPATNNINNALGKFVITAKWQAIINCPCSTCGCLIGASPPVICDCKRTVLILLNCSIRDLYCFPRGIADTDNILADMEDAGKAAVFTVVGSWAEFRCYSRPCHGKGRWTLVE